MRRYAVMVAMAVACSTGLVADAAAQQKALAGYGIVLMHGKGGRPDGLVASLAAALKAEGAVVVTPRMAWAGRDGRPDKYDVTYEQSLAQIDKAIEQLKGQGASKIVVAGQSLGANAAIGYAARHGDGLAAVIALAPGHTPERMGKREILQGVATARQLVAAGKGGVTTKLPDLNQGETSAVPATPTAYLSFYDPGGPAVIPRNAAAMPAIPFLWVIGRDDPLFAAGRGYAYDKAAKHAKSKYLEVNSDHADTPDVARRDVIAWLKSL
jgi:pimeloyl-ACP methyl ester carboxylesterase